MSWPVAALEDVCVLLTDGTHYTPKDAGRGHPFLTVQHMTPTGLDFETCFHITDEDLERADKADCCPKPGDVLFSKDGTVGKVHHVTEKVPFAVLSSIAILRPDSRRVDSGYLKHLLRWPKALSEATKRKTGSAIRRIILADLREIPIPLPPLAEQKRIAAVLDKADDLRAKRRHALATLDTLLQSVFLDMFGDPVTNPKGWPVKPLGEIATVNRGKFTPRPRDDPQFYGGAYPFIQTGDVVAARTYVTRHKQTLNEKGLGVSKIFEPGTIAITIAANIGATAMLTYRMCFPDSVVGIVPHPASAISEFLEMQLRFFRQKLEDAAPMTAQRNINLEVLRPLRVIVPPLSNQSRFLALAQSVYQQAGKQESNAAAFEGLFASLQSAAFAGTLFGGAGSGGATAAQPRTLGEANTWLNSHRDAVDAHAKASSKRLIGRESL